MQIYDILKREHEEVKSLLADLIALKDDDEYRFVLVDEITAALIPHARAEEATFYNTLRAVDADKGIVSHSFKEHMEAETLLRYLSVKEKTHFDWRATAVKLQDALTRHIRDEETTIFNEARNYFSADEAESIGNAYLKLKPNFEGNGVFKSAADMVINMLPIRLANSIRKLDTTKH